MAAGVQLRCDLDERMPPLSRAWAHTVGSGHAPLALRADWRAQLARCRRELGFGHVRFHGLLSDDVGTLLCEKDELIYGFFNPDAIVDHLLSIGMAPLVELSFMPRALASGGATVFSYQANVTPPRDVAAWAELVQRLVGHWVDRYGRDTVRAWPFEVWNEPNLRAFWTGSQADYFALYRATARAIKAVDPDIPVGGPASAQNAWIEEFLAFCEREDLPADFVSTHHYPTDPFGQPGDATEAKLAAARRGTLEEQARYARRRAGRRPLYYTEWNTSSDPRDPLHDEPYAAAFVAKAALDVDGLVDAYSFWTFSDLFEENWLPSEPFHGGFGLFTILGVPKPAYRAFELLGRLGPVRHVVDGLHPTVDAWVTSGEDGLRILLVNHALPRHPIGDERVTLLLQRAPPPSRATVERIDARHANAKRVWRDLGSPRYPTPEQLDLLERASALVPEPCAASASDGELRLTLDLPAHAVALVTVRGGAA